ncbi:hypothetical protein BDU57DRAFT_511447 [Ampelomyces quisqualis]|uniref:Uncharacterized protein n=1 Tax=Ampelomyces quisqualis TaxID=50730 RepID=A0A6A5QSG4_AMPQU|nr:hypothetical protein BDU57DRAFT_511447 [Ampelomyces quisqualis]
MASAGTLPVESYQEAMWMLQQHNPQHVLLKGRTFVPPPGTAPHVLRRLGQEAAGRQHQQRQQYPQQRSPAPTANMIPTYARQSVRSQSTDPRAEAAYGQCLIDPRPAAPRAPSKVMGPPTPRATQRRPQAAEHPMSNIRIDAHSFAPSSASLSGYVRNPNGRSTAQLPLPSDYVPNLPIPAPSQAPSIGRTQGVSYMPHPSEVRSPSRPSPDAPKHGTRPLFSSLGPGPGPVFSPEFQSLSRPSPAAPNHGERPLFSRLSDGTGSTFIRHTTPASRKATPIPTTAPGSAPQMGMFAAPVSHRLSRQSKKARVRQQSILNSSNAQGDKAPVQQQPNGSHSASAQSKVVHRQHENMPLPSTTQSSNTRVQQQSTARPFSVQSDTGNLPQQHSQVKGDQGNATRFPQQKSVSRPSSVQSNIAHVQQQKSVSRPSSVQSNIAHVQQQKSVSRPSSVQSNIAHVQQQKSVSRPSSVQSNIAHVQQQKHTQVSGGEDNSAHFLQKNLARPSDAQDNTARVQQQQQHLPAKSDQGNRPIKEAHSRISQSDDGAKTTPTLEMMAGRALKVALAHGLLSPTQAIEKASKMRGYPVQQRRFIDRLREAIDAKKSHAQRAASATASRNHIIDLTASGGSSNKRKEPPTNIEQPTAKRQVVIDLTGSNEPVRKPQTQRKQQALTDMTNMPQQYPKLMDLDDESSTIHPLHSQATTQGVSLVDIAYGHDYHAFPVEPVKCMLDPPEAVLEGMRRRNAARKPDVYFAEPSIAAAYNAVRTGKVDLSYSGNNGGFIAPLEDKAWTDIERYTLREADGSLRARNEPTLSEEGAIVRYELMMHGLRYGWWPRR